MQFGASGSTVQGPVTVKYFALVKPTIMIRKTPHVPPMRGRPGGYRKDILGGASKSPRAILVAASKSPRAIDRKERRTYGLETVSQRWPAQQQLVCQGAESRPPSVRWGNTWGGAWGMRATLSSPLECCTRCTRCTSRSRCTRIFSTPHF